MTCSMLAMRRTAAANIRPAGEILTAAAAIGDCRDCEAQQPVSVIRLRPSQCRRSQIDLSTSLSEQRPVGSNPRAEQLLDRILPSASADCRSSMPTQRLHM